MMPPIPVCAFCGENFTDGDAVIPTFAWRAGQLAAAPVHYACDVMFKARQAGRVVVGALASSGVFSEDELGDEVEQVVRGVFRAVVDKYL